MCEVFGYISVHTRQFKKNTSILAKNAALVSELYIYQEPCTASGFKRNLLDVKHI